jgi:hypothetical protein
MDDSALRNRRRFLEGVSVGGGVLLAGCTEQLDLGGSDPDQMDSGDDASAGGVAAIAAIDQEAMEEEQVKLQEEFRSGNISREEARAEMETIQQEYLDEAMDALIETLESADSVSIEDEYPSMGAVTASGDAAALLGLLDSEDVSGLVSKADVESQVQTQQAQTTQG